MPEDKRKRLQYTPSGMAFNAPAKNIVYQNSHIALVDKRGLPIHGTQADSISGRQMHGGGNVVTSTANTLYGAAGLNHLPGSVQGVYGGGQSVANAQGIPVMSGMPGSAIMGSGIPGVATIPGTMGMTGIPATLIPGTMGMSGTTGPTGMPITGTLQGFHGPGVTGLGPGAGINYGAAGFPKPGVMGGGSNMTGGVPTGVMGGYNAPAGFVGAAAGLGGAGGFGYTTAGINALRGSPMYGTGGYGGFGGFLGNNVGVNAIPNTGFPTDGAIGLGNAPMTGVGINSGFGAGQGQVRTTFMDVSSPYAATAGIGGGGTILHPDVNMGTTYTGAGGSPYYGSVGINSSYASPGGVSMVTPGSVGSPYKGLASKYPGVSFPSQRMNLGNAFDRINVENLTPGVAPGIPTPRDWNAHASETMDFLRSMWKDGKMCDVVLQVCGVSLPAHRVAIAAHSDKYAHHFKSLHNTALVEIILSKTTPEAAKNVLCYIYTGVIEVNDNIIDAVVGCAKELGIAKIENLCKDYLFTVSIHKAFFYLEIAEKHDMGDAMAAIRRFIRRHFKEISHTANFVHVDSARLYRLLADDTLVVGSELDVFFAILRWIDFDRDNRICHAAELLRLVRFNHVSAEEIVTQVEPIQYIFQLPECKEILYAAFRFHALKSIGSMLAENSPEPLTRHMFNSPEQLARQMAAVNPDQFPTQFNPELEMLLKQIAATNPNLAAVMSANPELARLMSTNPDLARQMAANPELAQLMAMNTDLARNIAVNPELARVMAGVPDLTRQISVNPDLATHIAMNPDIARIMAANPDLARQLTVNSNLARLMACNPEFTRQIATSPEMARLLSTNPDLASVMAGNPEIGQLLAANSDLARQISRNPELASQITAHPEFIKQMARNPDLTRKVTANPDLIRQMCDNPDHVISLCSSHAEQKKVIHYGQIPNRVYTLPTSATVVYRS